MCVCMCLMQELSLAYGEDLLQGGRCCEAGLILARAGHCDRALAAFEECLEWRQAVMMAVRLNFTDLQFNELARRLASEFSSSFSGFCSLFTISVINSGNENGTQQSTYLHQGHSLTSFMAIFPGELGLTSTRMSPVWIL